jgi:phosphate transport system protein
MDNDWDQREVKMPRTVFEHELQQLLDRLLYLGSVVENNIVESVQVLRDRDMVNSERLIRGDEAVNQQRIDIMNDALALIATQQPVAGDMRLIASIIEVTGELERINDYVKGIAKNSLMIGQAPIPNGLVGEMPEMATKTRDMLGQALAAFSMRDARLARVIPEKDDEIDDLFNRNYRNLLNYVTQNPDSIELVNHLEWALHNLERAADRVTNICEWVVYTVTGIYAEMDSEYEAPPARSVNG